MKKLVLLVSVLFAIVTGISAQSIIGKWAMPAQEVEGMDLTGYLEYFPDGTLLFTMHVESNAEEFVFIYEMTMTGTYEVQGKALCREYNANSIKSSYNVRIRPEFKAQIPADKLKTVEKQLTDAFKQAVSVLDKEVGRVLRIMTSGGMYQQIVQLNEDVIVIDRPNSNSNGEIMTRVKQ